MKVALTARRLGDVVFAGAQAHERFGDAPWRGQYLWRLDLDRILHAIGLDKPDALDDVHVAVVRDFNGLAEWQEDLRKDGHGIDDQGIALPAAYRMAAERQVWIVRVCRPSM